MQMFDPERDAAKNDPQGARDADPGRTPASSPWGRVRHGPQGAGDRPPRPFAPASPFSNQYSDISQEENSYTFIPGLGLVPASPRQTERQSLRQNAMAIGLAFILATILPALLRTPIVYFFYAVFPQITILPSGHVNAPVYLQQLMQFVLYSITMFVPFVIAMGIIKMPMRTAFPTKKPDLGLALPGVGVALGASVIGLYCSSIVSSLFSSVGVTATSPSFTAPQGAFAFLLYFINVCVAPAVLEEFAFRGMMMQSLRRYGDGFALILSASLFALMHENIPQGINAFLMGLVIGYFVLLTGSIWTGILIHFVNNALSVAVDSVLVAMSESGAVSQTGMILFNNIVLLVYLVIGLFCVIFLTRSRKNMFCVNHKKTQLATGEKYRAFFSSLCLLVAVAIFVFTTIGSLRLWQ